MRKRFILAICLILVFAVFALGSSDSSGSTDDQGSGNANTTQTVAGEIGKYSVEIESCRITEDYEGKPVAIITYNFSNISDDDPASFMWTFEDSVYQNGVGLNDAYVLSDSANYDSDSQTKEIKKGASIKVQVAYELDDTTSDVEVEVRELISFDDKVVKKTFKLAE